MKATIDRNGKLTLRPETETEAYAAHTWFSNIPFPDGSRRPPDLPVSTLEVSEDEFESQPPD
jgi:hypothetical protein